VTQSSFAHCCSLVGSLLTAASSASAGITNYLNGPGWAAWQSDAAGFQTIDFTQYPQMTSITDQYTKSNGVTFSGIVPPGFPPEVIPPPFVLFSSNFVEDGIGVAAQFGVELTFSMPQHAIGLHLSDKASYKLFAGDVLVGQTFWGTGGLGSFHGLTSSVAFDRVQMKSFGDIGDDTLFFDNLYFSTVPGPGGLAVMAAGLLLGGRRRR
jgi:hypothetical protein